MTFAQYRLDRLDPRHGQPGGTAGQPHTYPDGSVDEGQAWADAVGSQQDAELAALVVAAQARIPKWMPADGLDQLGNGAFALPRMPGQGDDSYRQTLGNAFPIYSLGGSAQAVINALEDYGIPDVRVIAIYDAPAPIAPETSATSYSAFYVVLGPNLGSIAPLILGSCTLGGSTLLGSSATPPQVTALKRIILRWKASHGYPIKILFLDPQGNVTTSGVASYWIGRVLGDSPYPLGNCTLGGYII